jgi:N-acetylglucosamine-6-phosphate deacetylase
LPTRQFFNARPPWGKMKGGIVLLINIKSSVQMKKPGEDQFVLEAIHYETGQPVRIEIVNGLIGSIVEGKALKNEDLTLFIGPGLFDNQINGYANVDFSGLNLSTDDVITAVKALWGEGITSFLPTLITNSHEILFKNMKILYEALCRDEQIHDSIPGFHLEGPYISPEEGYRGCHPLKYIRKPSWVEFLLYQKASGRKIIQVTIAPELEGAMEFISLCTRNGIVVALGHTNASSEQIRQAVDRGARVSNHLGNGCANFIHRHKNSIWPQLADDRLTTSVIADGHHLSPEELQVFYKVKGPEKIILTSDVIYLSGMDPGRYRFLEDEVILTPEGMLINPELNCLAGASFPLKKGIENMMKFTRCSLKDSINMATANVTKLYGIDNLGKILTGKRADLILFELVGNQLKIVKTFLKGKLVYQA